MSDEPTQPIPPQIRQMLEAQGIELPPDPGQEQVSKKRLCEHLFTMPADEAHTSRWCRYCGETV